MSSADPDAFETLTDGEEAEFRVSGSRFLGQAFAATSDAEAGKALEVVQRRYHNATHHCWAYRLGFPKAVAERYDDDGEPTGTAGGPILTAIRQSEVLGAIVVVTRYYGGTKLGTGGLARAYGEAARLALSVAGRVTLWIERRLQVDFEFADLGSVETAVAKLGDRIRGVERVFDPAPRLLLTVKESAVDRVIAELVETTAGRARVSPLDHPSSPE